MVHKTVLKVDVSCDKCKQEVLNIVSELEGVNKMEADSEKCTLIVIGEVDPFDIIKCLRKAGKKANLVSVGPPPPPPKQEEKKQEPKPAAKHDKCQCQCHCPGGCSAHKHDVHKCACSGPCNNWAYKPEYSKCQCQGPGGCWVCQPIAVMGMSYQDPAPPICSIM